MLSKNDRPAIGLRERKKVKTRAAIQQHALRLFREQGYAATTVDQIANAAELSPSTFFRYFPTKEDVVLYDAIDPIMIAAFKAQPPELNPIQALRRGVRAVVAELPAEELAQQRERLDLFLAAPELRAAWMGELFRSLELLAELIADRSGRSKDDFAVRNLAGAVFGVAAATLLPMAEDPEADLFALLDAGMAHLEAGLPL